VPVCAQADLSFASLIGATLDGARMEGVVKTAGLFGSNRSSAASGHRRGLSR
jgi:hypothetical protein